MKSTYWAGLAAAAAGLLLAGCSPKDAAETDGAKAPAAAPEITQEQREAEQQALYDAALARARASRGAGEPAIWTLADEDTTIYLIGTVHLLRPDLDWRTDAIDEALNEADTLVFEADVNSQEAARDMMQFVSTRALFTDGRRLNNLLDGEQEAELEEALKPLGYSLESFQTFRPWYAAVNLSVLQMTKDGFDASAGVEQVLEREGREAGKSFEYLETIEQQLGHFADLPDKEQVDFLMSSAEAMEEGAELLDMLVEEWEDGDVAGLGALMANPEMMGSEAVYDALLKSRNANWVPKIEAMLDQPGTVLIAVGAGHLAGEDSVIEMLRADGHEVAGP